MRKNMFYLLITIFLFICYLRYVESKTIFIPQKNLDIDPAYIGLAFEDVYFKTKDNLKINAWFIPADKAKYTIIFFHGNGGNIGHRLEKLRILNEIGVNVFIVDYRGYGNSQGRPSEKGVYVDAKAAYDYLIQEKIMSSENILIYGESLGGAVAVDLASKVDVAGVILESTFSSGRDMAREFYPFIPPIVFTDFFNSASKVSKIKFPKLFIHSKSDEIVPFSLARKLYSKAVEPKYFVEIVGGHNVGFLDSEEKFKNSIKKFISVLEES